MGDSAEEIQKDVQTIGRIDAVPMLLRVISETTGMGFSAVARVTAGTWTACAVHDRIDFNLKPGGQLDVHTTLCKEVREARAPVVIEQASTDPVYCDHHTPRTYGIESYVSVPIVLSNGEYFGNLCAIDPRPAKVAQPQILGMFTSFAQLIALHLEAERDSEAAEAALFDERAAGELREQFIAVLGHDLRNPLASVGACGILLEKQADDPARVRSLAQRIADNVRRMSALIDDTLDLARGRLGGGIAVAAEPVEDLEAALQAVVAELRDAHPARRIDCRIDVRTRVVCDRGRVQQLVSNLLGNALVHGAEDGTVRLVAGTAEGALVIEVVNDGEPIPADSLAKVFAPFWRSSTSAKREGLGLGLYICSQIVKAHHGTLEVRSTREAGTRFTARLPLQPVPTPH
jgi:signal transduction histidine kinase